MAIVNEAPIMSVRDTANATTRDDLIRVNVMSNAVELGRRVLDELIGRELGKVSGVDLSQHMAAILDEEMRNKVPVKESEQ